MLRITSKATNKLAVLKESKQKDVPRVINEKLTLRIIDWNLYDVLKPIAESLKCYLIIGPEVENKKITLDFNEVGIDKILEAILFPLGYGFKIQGETLVVLACETKVFRILLPPVVQEFKDLTSNESGLEADNTSGNTNNLSSKSEKSQQIKLGTKIVVSHGVSDLSFWEDVTSNLKSLMTAKGRFSINKTAGEVIVTDSPVNLESIKAYFEDLNMKISQQIEVDVKVVEVALNHENHFGVDWNALAKDLKTINSLGLSTNFASENFISGSILRITGEGSKEGSGMTQNGIRAAINALSKQGTVNIVSQPRIRMLNNQVAVIQVGSTQSYVDNTSFEVTQTGTITSISTSQIQEGVTMRLLGNIVGNEIYLSVTPVVTTIDNIRTISSGNTKIEAPQTTTKSINTMVKLKESETVAIGGLITSYHQKEKQTVPFISRIPLIGKLFEYDHIKNNKSELIIFITPKKGA